ncbi:hypothetical protein [Phenylobacterium kunshanense]|uniref:Uncharacterized protein n=1 Tax=Phenylobacterium kunshanense TaxID=1445034 RepID=A0A328BQQ5_9CAUL|nr:hypothetical protein [Phenylobacterium kunshanense]RAK68841.1 hypothetical protein DJ019_02160 [Phenylobacterium kunshanense]
MTTTPIAQLIAELLEFCVSQHPMESDLARARRPAIVRRAAEALARQEELLAEAGKVLAVIAEGSVPPEQAGHYIAHRRCVTAAREAVRMLHSKARETQ